MNQPSPVKAVVDKLFQGRFAVRVSKTTNPNVKRSLLLLASKSTSSSEDA